MGDPLSVAASAAGLIALGLQGVEYLHKYYVAYRDQSKDIAKTCKRLDELQTTLHLLGEVVRGRHGSPSDISLEQVIEHSILQCADVIHELQQEAQKFAKVPGKDAAIVKAAGRRITYPFRRSTLEKLQEDLDDFENNLSSAVDILQLKEHQYTQRSVSTIKDILDCANQQERDRNARNWLRAPDAAIDYNTTSAKRHGGTGRWLIQSDQFQEWFERPNSSIWLHGSAGCGKSVLCSTAIQHITRAAESRKDVAFCFFFFAFNDDGKQDASTLVRALLSQLLGQVAGLGKELAQLQASRNHGLPPLSALLSLLRIAFERTGHMYVVIDAVDESPEEMFRSDVLFTIRAMREWNLPCLHLLVTSRDYLDIREALAPDWDTMIDVRTSGIEADISDYVAYVLENDFKLTRWRSHNSIIKDHLIGHAAGNFQWVCCQLDPLRRCPQSKHDLLRCLQSLPQSLNATYARMIGDIDHYAKDRARLVLILMCLATPRLSVAEILDALAVDVIGDCYDVDRRLRNADDIRRICPGLIEIIPSLSGSGKAPPPTSGPQEPVTANGRWFDDAALTQTVRLSHFSIHEYLMSPHTERGVGSGTDFAISATVSHEELCKICLIYLCNDQFLDEELTPDLIKDYPFAIYAARFWYYHFLQAQNSATNTLKERVLGLIDHSRTLARWIRLYDPDIGWDGNVCYGTQPKTPVSALYYSALLGLDAVIPDITARPLVNVNAQEGGYGTVLNAASARGHEQTVSLLLAAGADPESSGQSTSKFAIAGVHGNALYSASQNGQKKVVELLLASGVDANSRSGRYGCALQAASREGHADVARALLDAGAKANLEGGWWGNALQAAAYYGHDEVAEMLIAAGADVNARGGRFATPLQSAFSGGQTKVMQMLVQAGAVYQNRLFDASKDRYEFTASDDGIRSENVVGYGSRMNVAARSREIRRDLVDRTVATNKKRDHRATFIDAASLTDAGLVVTDALAVELIKAGYLNVQNADAQNVWSLTLWSIGIDSLLAVELRHWIRKTFAADVGVLEILANDTTLLSLGAVIARKSQLRQTRWLDE